MGCWHNKWVIYLRYKSNETHKERFRYMLCALIKTKSAPIFLFDINDKCMLRLLNFPEVRRWHWNSGFITISFILQHAVAIPVMRTFIKLIKASSNYALRCLITRFSKVWKTRDWILEYAHRSEIWHATQHLLLWPMSNLEEIKLI